MTDNEIIKVLECCGKEYSCEKCALNTWLDKKRDCTGAILVNALDLINRQKEKNESLKVDLAKFSIRLDNLYKTADEIKSEAIKEFAEKLKGYAIGENGSKEKAYFFVEVQDIDNLIKEMEDNNV